MPVGPARPTFWVKEMVKLKPTLWRWMTPATLSTLVTRPAPSTTRTLQPRSDPRAFIGFVRKPDLRVGLFYEASCLFLVANYFEQSVKVVKMGGQ